MKPLSSPIDFIRLHDCQIPLVLVRNVRARRYILRLGSDGSARVTIPRAGTIIGARQFAERNVPWLERARQRLGKKPAVSRQWTIGTEIFFRGEQVVIQAEGDAIRFGSELLKTRDVSSDLRPAIEKHLWKLAAKELPPRVIEFALTHRSPVRRISIRNQRSRWGSCSARGTISLNWRIIMAPGFVRDYLIWHELMHMKQMNHSARFWAEVERVCPDYQLAETWLRKHSTLLR